MARSLFSSSWYRVANTKPWLRRQALIYRHDYRRQPWYVLEDRAGDRFHRFAPATFFVIGLMNGKRTVDEIWRAALAKLGDDAPSQDDMLELLAQLHSVDLLRSESGPESDDLFRRFAYQDKQSLLKMLSAPLAYRVSLFDPEKLLSWLGPLARLIYSWPVFILWILTISAGSTLAVLNRQILSQSFTSELLAPWNLFSIMVAYLILKFVHELSHALAVKAYGGRVHDVGLMFIVLLPMPYVDASAASAFSSKWKRIVVDSAGIMVELLFASVALYFWLSVGPGPAKSVLFNLVLIGSISTIFFNGNPLLKFDGYYIVSDLLEIPNLAHRSQAYIAYLFKRYMFGAKSVRTPVTANGERFWFLLYGPAAAIYRIALTFSIALFMATQYMLVGVLLAGWSLIAMGLLPIAKGLYSLFNDQDMLNSRRRIGMALALIAAGLGAALFVVPAPYSTIADAYVSVPDNAIVRTDAEGFATRMLVQPGSKVGKGDALLELSDPTLLGEVRVVDAEVLAIKAEIKAAAVDNTVEKSVLEQKLQALEEEQKSLSKRRAEQRVLSPLDGVFLTPQASDLTGLLITRGSVIGYVWSPERFQVSAFLDQVGVGNVRNGLKDVQILSSEVTARPLVASIMRTFPGGVDRLPHKALSTEGGGSIATDPRYPTEMRLANYMFRIDVTAQGIAPTSYIGQRFEVRFRHEPKPLGFQIATALRRLLLDRFGL